MGALHAGHVGLIGTARAKAEAINGRVVVSVFVNPAQFNERADFDRYPRDLETDVRHALAAGADAVFAPEVPEVYPGGVPTGPAQLPTVALGRGLEDEGRTGHFDGVVRVLGRLYELTGCSAAVFGEKDWQQFQVARATATEGVEIVGHPIVRDTDGLALSSRNVHLSPDGRARALAIPRAVRGAQDHATVGAAEAFMRATLGSAGVEIAYATVRDAETLGVLEPGTGRFAGARVLVTGSVEGVRLLDNGPWVGP